MRLSHLVLFVSLAVEISTGKALPNNNHGLAVRQDNSNSAFPTLGASNSPTPSNASPTPTEGQGSATASNTEPPKSSPSPSASGSGSGSGSSHSNSATSTRTSSTQDASPTPTVQGNSTAHNGTSSGSSLADLPLQPRITPALGIAGVILMLSGIVYGIIGVKNRWIHVFLSTGYLTSLSILVLIVYVMNPPVSDAIQGAYFVGILMTGLIFGCGALIFKEVTEGLGCLLGGFALAMWFLTLKEGGLMTDTLGKAIMIAVFCVVCWALSFSHYTRAYALIGSTSFAGATAFILGIDCFARAGLKEFWVYLWGLNNNLFPLNTNTYPITRGTRVESIVIVLGCLVGIISQIKLWKVVRDRHKAREAERLEDERKQDAVDEALGRHLQRQNDRDRSEWEKRYGDRLGAKRNTVSWVEAHPDKRFSTISTQDVGSSQTSSSDSLEMANLNHTHSRTSLLGAKGLRQSTMTVQAIPEVEEDEIQPIKPADQMRDSGFVENSSTEPMIRTSTETPRSDAVSAKSGATPVKMPSSESLNRDSAAMPSLRPQSEKPTSEETVARLHLEPEDRRNKKRSSMVSLNNLKRRSFQSLLTRNKDSSKRDLSPAASQNNGSEKFSESKEALVAMAEPVDVVSAHSRASSVAATLDGENENIDLPDLETLSEDGRAPQIIISSVGKISLDEQFRALAKKASMEPPELADEEFDVDPEELVRPVEEKAKSVYSSQDVDEPSLRDGAKSSGDTSQTLANEILTKDALQRVPSQLSHVVLSYRTNEWAKHIANADAPVFEEPEPIIVDDEEEPVHLADPKSPPQLAHQPEEPRIERPPELPSPVNAVAPSLSGIKVNPEVLPPEKTPTSPVTELPSPLNIRSRPTSGESFGQQSSASVSPQPPSQEFSQQAAPAMGLKRSQTDPSKVPTVNRAARRLSNPMGRQATLQSVIIDENEVTEFAPSTQRNSLNESLPATTVRAESPWWNAPQQQNVQYQNPQHQSVQYQNPQYQNVQYQNPQYQNTPYQNSPYQTYGMSTPNLVRSPSGGQYSTFQKTASMSNLAANNPYGSMKRTNSSSSNLINYAGNANPMDVKRSSSTSNLLNGMNLISSVQPSQSPLAVMNPALLRSSTRLSHVDNSHQPISRHNTSATDQARREALMADWRLSNHQSATVHAAPKVQADTRRAQMLYDYEQTKMRKEKEQHDRMVREAAFDQSMRNPGMIDVHRDMMRKMQMQANQKMTK